MIAARVPYLKKRQTLLEKYLETNLGSLQSIKTLSKLHTPVCRKEKKVHTKESQKWQLSWFGRNETASAERHKSTPQSWKPQRVRAQHKFLPRESLLFVTTLLLSSMWMVVQNQRRSPLHCPQEMCFLLLGKGCQTTGASGLRIKEKTQSQKLLMGGWGSDGHGPYPLPLMWKLFCLGLVRVWKTGLIQTRAGCCHTTLSLPTLFDLSGEDGCWNSVRKKDCKVSLSKKMFRPQVHLKSTSWRAFGPVSFCHWKRIKAAKIQVLFQSPLFAPRKIQQRMLSMLIHQQKRGRMCDFRASSLLENFVLISFQRAKIFSCQHHQDNKHGSTWAFIQQLRQIRLQDGVCCNDPRWYSSKILSQLIIPAILTLWLSQQDCVVKCFQLQILSFSVRKSE